MPRLQTAQAAKGPASASAHRVLHDSIAGKRGHAGVHGAGAVRGGCGAVLLMMSPHHDRFLCCSGTKLAHRQARGRRSCPQGGWVSLQGSSASHVDAV